MNGGEFIIIFQRAMEKIVLDANLGKTNIGFYCI